MQICSQGSPVVAAVLFLHQTLLFVWTSFVHYEEEYKIRQNFVYTNERYACSSNNLCNWCFLTVKFNNVFFCICHHYFFNGTHQVTGAVVSFNFNPTRFISWFYIKPQQFRMTILAYKVASYLDSTSNHNTSANCSRSSKLLHILILHQTTTLQVVYQVAHRCFISWFYIKPQQSC